jgi:hypothetical protein
MARFDKVWIATRATAGTALSGLMAVKLSSGVVPSGSADAIGVVCIQGTIAAGEPVAIMHRGEIVEFSGTAETAIYAVGGGTVDATPGGTKIGTTIEADRLVVLM